uniref:Ubiquitin specific peptidase 50 n=1 Tax=Pavo cristatus TaxID=9049 RepID=A0A8C9FT76_PAVCR
DVSSAFGKTSDYDYYSFYSYCFSSSCTTTMILGLLGAHMGNCCYVNAILHCLCSMSLLMEYFLSREYEAVMLPFEGRLDCISLEGFCSVLGEQCPTVSKRTQRDVQEFVCMLNELQEALKKVRDCLPCFSQQDTLTWNNQLHCSCCGTKQDAAVKATTAEVQEGNFTDICSPLSNMDLSPYSYLFFCKNSEYSSCALMLSFAFPTSVCNTLSSVTDKAWVCLDLEPPLIQALKHPAV